MRVHELMSSTVCSIEQETGIRQAAALMRDFGVGALPVLDGRYLVGIVTDRDLAVRAIALALPPDAPVSLVMTAAAHACAAGEDVADVLLDMQSLQLRRIPVENEADELVGVLSLGDLAAGCTNEEIGRTLRRICCRGAGEVAGPGLDLAA